jgi:hypothetical protein
MTDEIKVGTVLIKEGTRLPRRLQLESESFSNGWRLIQKLDGHGLSRRIRELGWVFVNMAGEIRATALGFDRRGAVRRAANRGFTKRSSSGFSCLEITQVTVERIFGLLYVTVAARPRSIQEEMEQLPSRNIGEWHRAKLAGA